MTLEEKAKLFRENLVCSTTRHIGRENYEYIEQAYLAGLYEGQPKWHDLRENPNDLPKVNGQYWVCYEDSVNIGRKGYEMWVFINEKWEHTAKVIAWYELPTFDKE